MIINRKQLIQEIKELAKKKGKIFQIDNLSNTTLVKLKTILEVQ
jgi:hypothetical protein